MMDADRTPARFQRIPEVTERSVDEDRFLVVQESEAIYHLNPLGAALWQLLSAPHSRDEIKATLAAAFDDVPAGRTGADADAFLDALLLHGLVRTCGSR